jgi:hypothetical protein
MLLYYQINSQSSRVDLLLICFSNAKCGELKPGNFIYTYQDFDGERTRELRLLHPTSFPAVGHPLTPWIWVPGALTSTSARPRRTSLCRSREGHHSIQGCPPIRGGQGCSPAGAAAPTPSLQGTIHGAVPSSRDLAGPPVVQDQPAASAAAEPAWMVQRKRGGGARKGSPPSWRRRWLSMEGGRRMPWGKAVRSELHRWQVLQMPSRSQRVSDCRDPPAFKYL